MKKDKRIYQARVDLGYNVNCQENRRSVFKFDDIVKLKYPKLRGLINLSRAPIDEISNYLFYYSSDLNSLNKFKEEFELKGLAKKIIVEDVRWHDPVSFFMGG